MTVHSVTLAKARPRVAVVMSVHNGEPYLKAAIDSILSQTFEDFHFIIIDDGSMDRTADIVRRYAQLDKRVQLVKQSNIGLTASLNKGIAMSDAEFIARMDGDDIAVSNRLERQVLMLQDRLDLVACGTSYHAIDANGCRLNTRYTEKCHEQIDTENMLGNTAMAHPTMMFRRTVFEEVGGYDESYQTCQDLDLQLKFAEAGGLVNLSEPLLHYRWHDRNVSISKIKQQDQDVTLILRAARRRRNLPVAGGIPLVRWQFRRVLARKYAMGGQRRQALRFGAQSVVMRPFSPRSWYSALLVPWLGARWRRTTSRRVQ